MTAEVLTVMALIVGASVVIVFVAALIRAADDDLDALIKVVSDDRVTGVGLGARIWAIGGARVVNDRFGVGTVLETPNPGWVLVAFDAGTLVELRTTEISPITPDDEQTLRELRAARDAAAAARAVTEAAPRLNDLVPAYCDGLMSCTSHDAEHCTGRPCCSTCPTTREDRTL